MTGVVLVGIALVVLLYREVVSVYTRAGGSYVVARDNFGPRVAQVAAVALMIDYIVTVAVQTAAGSAAILSAFPALGKPLGGNTTLLLISVVAILIMCYGNLRGIKEAGRTFALPTYLFSGSVGLMIVVGLAGRSSPGCRVCQPPLACTATAASVILATACWRSASIFVLLRAFANGGSSLTGIEAVSNAVSALRAPAGRNARQVLVIQGTIVGVPDRGHLLARARDPCHPVPQRLSHGPRPGGRPHIRPRRAWAGAVLRGPGRHGGHPLHRRQH